MTQVKSLSLALIGLFVLLLVTSCSRPIDLARLSEDDVAELLEATLSQANGGLTENLESLTEHIDNLTLEDLCDQEFRDSLDFARQGHAGEAAYSASWTLDLSCTQLNVPEMGSVSTSSQNSYETPRISSTGSSAFAGSVSGLQPLQANMIWEGSYQKSGTQVLQFEQENTISSTLDLTLVELSIGKLDTHIHGGTGSFSMHVSKDEHTSTYAGTIVFHGDDTATIVLNGVSYPIHLQ
ncbi:MAG: hypothetical protein AAF587_34295 [Bacteroidota bacterium]